MDADELRDFLLTRGIDRVAAQSLHDQRMNESMLMSSDKESLRELAAGEGLESKLTSAVIQHLVRVRDELKETSEKEAAQTSAGSTLPPSQSTKAPKEGAQRSYLARRGPITRQQERTFCHPVNSWKGYTWGNYLTNEIGTGTNSLLEPCREFKRFDLRDKTVEESEDAFIERVYEFCFACLNARSNGTIYFGVEDGATGQYQHGQIVGLWLSPNQKKKLQEILEQNLTKEDAKLLQGLPSEEKVAIQSCIKSLQFVPVTIGVPEQVDRQGQPDAELCVVELDVEPDSVYCGDLRFKLAVKRPGAKGNRRKKSDPKAAQAVYFFRDGANNQSFTEREHAKMDRITAAIKRRAHQEKERKAEEGRPKKEKELIRQLSLGRSSGFPNKNLRYVLLLNELDHVEEEALKWIGKIGWFAILDFGADDQKRSDSTEPPNTYFKHFYQGATVRQVTSIRAEALHDVPPEEINSELYSLGIGTKTLHVRCCPVPGTVWHQSVMAGLTKFISVGSNYNSEKLMGDVVLVTLVGSHQNLTHMAEVLKEFNKVIDTSQMVCIHDNPQQMHAVNSEVERFFGNSWAKERTFHFRFETLNQFLLTKIGQSSGRATHLLPASSGVFQMEEKSVNFFAQEGIDILPSNMFAYLKDLDECESDAFIEKNEREIVKFLKGSIAPPWVAYFVADSSKNPGRIQKKLTHGLVERDILFDILKEVKNLKRGTENIVARLPVIHHPGAGATTIARHALWTFREDYRCVLLDGDRYAKNMGAKLQRTAEQILNFRELGELEEIARGGDSGLSCPPILVLFDNCSPEMAKLLTSYIEKKCEERGIVSRSRILVMMCLYSSFNYRAQSVDSYDVESRNPVKIERTLSEGEKIRFSSKLEELKDKRESVDDLLAFILIANEFDENSDYVKGVVNNTLLQMKDAYPRQRKLLQYLSVLRYFGNSSLPHKHCVSFVFGPLTSDASVVRVNSSTVDMKKFSAQFESLVAFQDLPNDTGGGSFWAPKKFISISHVPVACQLLKALLPEGSLASCVEEMLKEQTIIDINFQKIHVHETFRALLNDRVVDEKTLKKDRFSKVVETILATESRDSAINVLQLAYAKLQEEYMKANLAQTMARIYCEQRPTLEEAKRWAEAAAIHAPKSFAIRDTQGQVFKTEMRYLTEDRLNKDYYLKECREILAAWKKALHHFHNAQKLYYQRKRRRRESSGIEETMSEEDSREKTISSSNTPFGIVESNLMMLKVIVGSKDIKQQQQKKDQLLRGLMKEDLSMEISSLFMGSDELPWEEYHSEIMDLFSVTRDSLHLLTRKLSYVYASQDNTEQVEFTKHLGKQVEEFNNVFGSRNHKWMDKISSPKVPPEQKIAIIRRFMQTGLTNSFGWLSRSQTRVWRREVNLVDYAKYLQMMVRLNKEISGKDYLLVDDKVSYCNVAFSLRIKQSRDADQFAFQHLDYDLVKKFCQELVRNRVDQTKHPEAYFFFSMVFWPSPDKNGNLKEISEDDFVCLIASIVRLAEARREDHDWGRPRQVFYLGAGEGIDRFVQEGGGSRNQRIRLRGQLNEAKNVVVSMGEGKEIVLRNVKPFQRNKESAGPRERVSFCLGFTFAGPVALDVVSREWELERQRLHWMNQQQ